MGKSTVWGTNTEVRAARDWTALYNTTLSQLRTVSLTASNTPLRHERVFETPFGQHVVPR